MSTHHRLYPEARAGGFSRVDGNVEFYSRVSALIDPSMTVLDFGAGRGVLSDDPVPFRRDLALLKGRVAEVIGVDVDDVVLHNPTLDRAMVIVEGRPLPLPDASIDLAVSSFVFEHVRNPASVSAELDRVMRPGGWLCARTPTKWGYVGIGARLFPNSLHVSALRRLQPQKLPEDTFPVAYRLNTLRDLDRWFPPSRWENLTYTRDTEPAYFGSSVLAWRAAQVAFRLTPPRLAATMYIFLRKREG